MRALVLVALVACGGGEVADGDEVEASVEAPGLDELNDGWTAVGDDGDGYAIELDDGTYSFYNTPRLDGDPAHSGTASIETRAVDNFGVVEALVLTSTTGDEQVSAFVRFLDATMQLSAFESVDGYLTFVRVSAP